MKNDHAIRRRNFLGEAALAGGALAAAAKPGTLSAATKQKRPLRIGALCVGDFSFWNYSWCDLLAPADKPVYKGTLGTNLFNMEVTHVWDRDPAAARKFGKAMGAEAVARYDGMVGKVDAVAFGGYYEVPWQHRLVRPYIEAGIPTFLDRPFAFSLRDLDTLLECIAKHNTPVMATDVYEHLYDTTNLRGRLPNLGEIRCVHGTCWGGDYGGHYHIKFMLPKIFGFEVDRISILTDNPFQSSYLNGTWLMKGHEGQKPYLISSTLNQGDLYSITVDGTKAQETARMPWIDDWNRYLLGEHVSWMTDMQRTFEGHMYEPLDLIRRKTELFLTGLFSATERNGAFVRVGEVPIDWRGPVPRPGWIEESVFS